MKKKGKESAGPEKQTTPKKRGMASKGDSSRTQKGDPSQKAKGKAEGRK